MYNLRVLSTTALAAAAMLITTLPAKAETVWEHNGSLVSIEFPPDTHVMMIHYLEPRKGLAEAGIHEGTELFWGTRNPGNLVVGTAYVFKKGCAPASYPVSGVMNDTEPFTLSGPAPVRADNGCEIIGYTENKNSKLKFTFSYGGG